MSMPLPPLLKRFGASRRGAIMMLFAICLVPLVMIVGLAIDYSFFVQTSQQVSLAAEAASTQAVRTAAAMYAQDIDNGDSVTTATADAVTYGEAAGTQWFYTQAGDLVRGSANSPSVLVSPNTGSSGAGAGFSATVNYSYNYPPFFNSIFNQSSSNTWVYSNQSAAQAVNKYVEVLLLLDTSGSMQIGANPSDIATLSDDSVCFPSARVTNTNGDVPLILSGSGYYLQLYPYSATQSQPAYASEMATDGDLLNFASMQGYNDPSNGASDTSGSCKTPTYGVSISGGSATSPGSPCALACHTTTNTAGGYFTDPYGYARYLGVTLRSDVVITAAESVAQDLYDSEQASNQFSLGVYQFNNDVSAMVDGGANAEATSDLTDAKTTIENYDYAYKGNSALLPTLQANSNPNTNFPLAIKHLVNGGGTVPTLVAVTNTQANPAGSTSSNPIKNIFIVTDGLEDSSSLNTGGGNGLTLDSGEMTSWTAENYYTSTGNSYSGNATGYCSKLKQLGFNVYVLYVTYYPLPFLSYYQAELGEQANYADSTDFPSAFSYGSGNNVFPRSMTVATSVAETTGTNPDKSHSATGGLVSPTEEALEACASNGDFYIASSASDISTAMTEMLQSAIQQAIQVTK